MKTILKIILLSFLIVGCTEKTMNRTELYQSVDNGLRTFNSHTGKPYTGIGVLNNGPFDYNRTIETNYDDGYIVRIVWIDSKGRIRADLKSKKDGTRTGELYYNENGDIVSKREFYRPKNEQ